MAAPLWRGLSRLRFGACSDLVHAVGAALLLGRLRSMAWLGFSTPRRGASALLASRGHHTH